MNESIFEQLDYNGVLDFFASLRTGLIYIGGSWCKTCESIKNEVVRMANKCGVKKIYQYDPHFVNVYGDVEDLRDCKSLEIKMDYYKLVENLEFRSNELVKNTLIPRIHLPLFAAVKFGKCEKYYSAEFFKEADGTIHALNSTEDCTEELLDNLQELMDIVNIGDTLLI